MVMDFEQPEPLRRAVRVDPRPARTPAPGTPTMIAGYLGKSAKFDVAIAAFAAHYADVRTRPTTPCSMDAMGSTPPPVDQIAPRPCATERGPRGGPDRERAARQLLGAAGPQGLASRLVESGHVGAGRADAQGVGLPPLVEAAVPDLDGQHSCLDVAQPGRARTARPGVPRVPRPAAIRRERAGLWRGLPARTPTAGRALPRGPRRTRRPRRPDA